MPGHACTRNARYARVPAPDARLRRRAQGGGQTRRASCRRRLQPFRDDRDPRQSVRRARPRGVGADAARSGVMDHGITLALQAGVTLPPPPPPLLHPLPLFSTPPPPAHTPHRAAPLHTPPQSLPTTPYNLPIPQQDPSPPALNPPTTPTNTKKHLSPPTPPPPPPHTATPPPPPPLPPHPKKPPIPP